VQCGEIGQPNDPIKAPADNHGSFRGIARGPGAKRGGKVRVTIDQCAVQSGTHELSADCPTRRALIQRMSSIHHRSQQRDKPQIRLDRILWSTEKCRLDVAF
jgi:hypothetical protein